MYQGRQTIAEIIDKTKGRIKQALGDLTGNKRLKREGGPQGQVKDAVKDAKDAVNGRIRNWHSCSTK
jgi:uncharacterized protein YjbJ (UPF0337 family)